MQTVEKKDFIKYFRQIVEAGKKFVLTTHVNPDADGLGCELAVNRFLRKLGKESIILNHSETPENHLFLDYDSEIVKFLPAEHANIILGADVLIAFDMNNQSRLRTLEEYFVKSKAVKVVVDHHLDAEDFADYMFIDLDSAASAEIIYNLLKGFNPAILDKTIAEPLYAGIMTDTGSFRFPRTDAALHRLTAELLELGVDPTYVYNSLYEQNSLGRTHLLGEVLTNVQLAYNGRLSYFTVTLEQLIRNGVKPDETDGFVNHAAAIKGVAATLFFMELPDGVKISFRSKGNLAVNEVAKIYGGGGHKNASGARIFGRKLYDVIPDVLTTAGKILFKEEVSMDE
ncbi:MAG: DHH family phosphoesterase [Candidatus Kryptoniota bacterium]